MKRVLIAALLLAASSALANQPGMPDDLRQAMVVDLAVCTAYDDIVEAENCLDEVADRYAEQWASRNRSNIAAAQQRAEAVELRRIQSLRNQWNVDIKVDPLTDKEITTISLKSDNTHRFRFPFHDENYMILQVRTHPRFGEDIILQIVDGQFACYSTRCAIDFRIDNGELITVGGNRSSDGNTRLIFVKDSDMKKIVHRVLGAETIFISTTIHEGGNPVFEFTAKK